MITDKQIETIMLSPGPDGRKTIADWLIECMAHLIYEDEGFSGKRPLGNSGWFVEFEEACAGFETSPDWNDILVRWFRRD